MKRFFNSLSKSSVKSTSISAKLRASLPHNYEVSKSLNDAALLIKYGKPGDSVSKEDKQKLEDATENQYKTGKDFSHY